MKNTRVKPKEKVYMVKASELDKYRLQGYNKALNESVKLLFALTFLMLRDEFKFGKVRQLRALKKLSELIKDLSDDRFELKDIQEVLKVEVGVDIFESSIVIKD